MLTFDRVLQFKLESQLNFPPNNMEENQIETRRKWGEFQNKVDSDDNFILKLKKKKNWHNPNSYIFYSFIWSATLKSRWIQVSYKFNTSYVHYIGKWRFAYMLNRAVGHINILASRHTMYCIYV